MEVIMGNDRIFMKIKSFKNISFYDPFVYKDDPNFKFIQNESFINDENDMAVKIVFFDDYY